MSELAARYDSKVVETKWYDYWLKNDYFSSVPDDREAFSIVIPPPNVTGVLHMGHMLNNTIQDILIRKARMEGKNACWVPGTDHASIATEAKVVKWIREEMGLRKSDISREEFLKYAYQWKDKYGGIILNQLQKLGASCDWKRTAFTMDEIRSEGVYHVFVDLYNKGVIYRGLRMINWDPEAKTVLSNEEVIHSEEQSNLYHVKYFVENEPDKFVIIATQRPETIMADSAVAVHPNDPRYTALHGKKVIVPLINRAVPIITDNYVDIEFGTGALKVTPAHDPNDYELGQKHNLEVIDTINEDGSLNALCGVDELIGLDRFEARKKMKKLLEAAGNFEKLEPYRTNIGRSERTNSVVEPRLSKQWFVNMQLLAKPALDAVMNDDIAFFPRHFKNTYRHWMENIRDWCISRQLWWGHRVPAWYDAEGNEYIALTEQEAQKIANEKAGKEVQIFQDNDVLDTWFSSWLWPITVFDGFNKDSKDFPYYYPTATLVTGWDIMFFWVARMIMAGYEWKNQLPFKDVYFTGMVRDEQGRKMSKQLGNSPDALLLIDEYGADGMRFGVLSSSPAGGDLKFDTKLCENGRNFCNKLWNALRLVKGWNVDDSNVNQNQLKINRLATSWMKNRISEVLIDLENNFKTYRLSEALVSVYSFIWDDFCSWYLEMVKPKFGEATDTETINSVTSIFEELMLILHPFMPFVTEEIWQQLNPRNEKTACTISKYPTVQSVDSKLVSQLENLKEAVAKIREVRNNRGIKMSEPLEVFILENDNATNLYQLEGAKELVIKLGNLSSLEFSKTEIDNSVGFLAKTEQYFVKLNQTINSAEEKEKLEKELTYYIGFVKSINAKLSNEKFVNGAPAAVIENERKKLADGESKISMLTESISKL